MKILIRCDGTVQFIYGELLELAELGSQEITRASYVEPVAGGRWQADLSLQNGPVLGPFGRRSEAVAAEADWLERVLFGRDACGAFQSEHPNKTSLRSQFWLRSLAGRER